MQLSRNMLEFVLIMTGHLARKSKGAHPQHRKCPIPSTSGGTTWVTKNSPQKISERFQKHDRSGPRRNPRTAQNHCDETPPKSNLPTPGNPRSGSAHPTWSLYFHNTRSKPAWLARTPWHLKNLWKKRKQKGEIWEEKKPAGGRCVGGGAELTG
jgi:hypothetical protein